VHTERHAALTFTATLLRVYELELELIQTQMTQKPVLRAEVYAHAMRASQNPSSIGCLEFPVCLLAF